MSNVWKNKWTRRGVIAVLVVVGCEQAWRHGHDYLWPDKFATVETGRIYRGAWQQDWPMRQLVKDYKIHTIVALAHNEQNKMVQREAALAHELGCKWLHIPIVDDRTATDSTALFDRLEEAAAAVADPQNQPVYFHCHHGINRASMVQMAYRMLYCGWDLRQATDEIARTFGLREVDKGPDYRHMTRFYTERVLPRRRLASKPTAAKNG
jgi:protein tyrosine/serine phosphatase